MAPTGITRDDRRALIRTALELPSVYEDAIDLTHGHLERSVPVMLDFAFKQLIGDAIGAATAEDWRAVTDKWVADYRAANANL